MPTPEDMGFDTKYHSPAEVEKRERAAAERQAKEAPAPQAATSKK